MTVEVRLAHHATAELVDALNRLVPQLSSIPIQFIDPYTWGPLEGTVNQWFTAHVVNG